MLTKKSKMAVNKATIRAAEQNILIYKSNNNVFFFIKIKSHLWYLCKYFQSSKPLKQVLENIGTWKSNMAAKMATKMADDTNWKMH